MSGQTTITPGTFDATAGGGGGGGFTPTPWVVELFLHQPSTDANDPGFVPFVAPLALNKEYAIMVEEFGPPPAGTLSVQYVVTTDGSFNEVAIEDSASPGFVWNYLGSAWGEFVIVVDPGREMVMTAGAPAGLGVPPEVGGATGGGDIRVEATGTNIFAIEKFFHGNGFADSTFIVLSRQVRA